MNDCAKPAGREPTVVDDPLAAEIVLEASGLGVFELDAASGRIRLSARCREIWGLTAGEEPTRERLVAAIHREDRHLAARMPGSPGPDGTGAFCLEPRVVMPDGATRWVQLRGRTVFDGQGPARRAVRSVGTMLDVTERRLAQGRLRASEDRLQQLLDGLGHGFVTIDRDWRFTYVNPAAAHILASTAAGLGGSVIWDAFPGLVGTPFERVYRRVMQGGAAERVTEWFADHQRWYEVAVHPYGEGISLAFRDVTEATRTRAAALASEATLSAVLDALPVGVAIADREGRVVRDNAALRAIWGVPPQEDWRRAALADREGYRPGTGRRIASQEWAISRALLRGEVVRGELVEVQPFGGGPRRFVLDSAAPVRDAEGQVVGGVVVELDVTEQRVAADALARTHAEAQAAAERVQLALAAGAIVGTWDWDLRADRFTVDDRFAESFGIAPALGRKGLSLEQVIASVHPDDLAGLRAAIDEAIRRGGPYSHDYRVRGLDGVYRWIQANGRVDHAADGTPTRFPGVLLDLERRRALEAERDRATQLLRAFVEAVPGVVYAKDSEGRMLLANRGVTELVGKPPERYLGRTDLEFLDDKAQAAAVMATDRRIMDSGRAETLEEEVNFPGRRRAVWLSTKAPFRDADGRVIGLIGSSLDITARKDADAVLRERTAELTDAQLRLQLALSAARMGVWDWSPVTGESRWSSQMYEILGLPPAADGSAHGETFIERVHPDDRPVLDAALARALAGDGDFEAEMRLLGDGEPVRWVLGRGRVLPDANGRPERMVGVNVDITERKLAEEALLESDRRRNEFLAMLGHELRNPLAPITHAVHLLELGGSQVERRNAAVQIIRRQTAHMTRLIDDLLEVSRVTQGRIELRKANILVASAVFSAVEAVRPLMRERAQTLEVDVAPEIDLLADQARLTQVVANLLNNASKYTQPGGHVMVRAQVVGDDEAWVEIVVADNGPGIDAELLPRVFDLFSQGATTLDRSRGGLGLGLALVKRLVELHGGSVRADSAAPGEGATFTVCLPRVERRRQLRTRAAGLPAPGLAPTSVLVVDDNVDAADMLAMLLESDGHRVARAHDGEEALAIARRFAPRVVLLDIGLPGLDGWEVAHRLRADPRTASAVLIAVSGYGQPHDRDRSDAAGFDDHLLKPVELDGVYAAARKRIDADPDAPRG